MKPKRDKAGPAVAAERPPRPGEVAAPAPTPERKRTRAVCVSPAQLPLLRATPDEAAHAEKMTPERAVEVIKRHLEAVGRGDPEALKVDREVTDIFRAREQAAKARRRRLDALAGQLDGLTDNGLAKVEALVKTLPRRRKDPRSDP